MSQWVKREVAVALGQMSLALQGAADPQMDDLNDLPPVMGPLTRMNSGTRSKAPAFDTKKILESVINLVHMLSGCSALYVQIIISSSSLFDSSLTSRCFVVRCCEGLRH